MAIIKYCSCGRRYSFPDNLEHIEYQCPFCWKRFHIERDDTFFQDDNIQPTGFWARHGLKTILVVIGLVLGFMILSNYFKPKPIVMGISSDLIITEQAPLQTPIESADTFEIEVSKGTFTLTPVARYSIAALVVSKKKYTTDWNSHLAPFDLALAWGDLALQDIDHQVKYEQYSRWYHFEVKPGSSLSIDYIYKHSANTHIIPSNINIHRAIEHIRKKDIVYLEGYLVNIKGTYKNRSYSWNSSTSRDDSGNGACEILFVNRVRIFNKIYE